MPRLFIFVVGLVAVLHDHDPMARAAAVALSVDMGLLMLRRHFWPLFPNAEPNPGDALAGVHHAMLLVAALGFVGWLCVEILTPPL
jgi:uncharacterized membrane protein (DUF4010 family)